MYTITVNETSHFQLDLKNGALFHHGESVKVDVKDIGNKLAHVIVGNRSFDVEVLEENAAEKKMVIKINSREFTVSIHDRFDTLLHQLGFDKAASSPVEHIKAPMPGLVLKLLVKEDQQVEKGDSLLILEAMKMENIIKSPVSGTIKKISVSEGDKLEKNQVIIAFK
jgi:biotin carboxyl carrier protein